jgi:ABC-2 type transport system permease protein
MSKLTKEKIFMIFYRIKILILLQSKDTVRSIKNTDKRQLIKNLIIVSITCIAITAIFIYFFSFIEGTFQFTLSEDMLITIIFLSQIITILSSMSDIINSLYTNKENLMLLAFPCKYSEIFASKLVIFFINELRKSLFFTLPFLIAFGISYVVPWSYWLLAFAVWILLAMIPMIINTMISIIVIYIKKFLHTHILAYILTLVVCLSGVFYLSYYFLSMLPTPIRIVAVYGKFIKYVNIAFASIASVANIYAWIGNILCGIKIYLYLPILLLIVIVGIGLMYFAVMPYYFNTVSSTAEKSSEKCKVKKVSTRKHKNNKKHKEPNKKVRLFITFMRKELLILSRDTASIGDIVSICLMPPIIVYIMNFVLGAINQNILGEYIVVAFNVMIILSLLSIYNGNMAAIFSREGQEFSILKTAPSQTSIIGWTKITITEVVNIVAIAINVILLRFITTISVVNLSLTFFTILLVSSAHILWSCQLDLNNPKIMEYAAKGNAVTLNGNIDKALVIGFIMATLSGALCLLLLMDSFVTGWLRLIIIVFAVLLLRLYLYKTNLDVYFRELEM